MMYLLLWEILQFLDLGNFILTLDFLCSCCTRILTQEGYL